MQHHPKRSPEAWSTASDSPTPTNSVAERSWTKNNLWDGLLCEEQRELLGTEEESSDRHSSDDDDEDHGLEVLEHPETLESLYQITPEQRTYYVNQFKVVQPDVNKLISGQVAKIYFEKSRIPVKELRHIWQLCDVTRDGALSLNEFIAAMHLIVLRRNSIPVPSVLPAILKASIPLGTAIEPPEADLLHLDDDKQPPPPLPPPSTSNRNSTSNFAATIGGDVAPAATSSQQSTATTVASNVNAVQTVHPKQIATSTGGGSPISLKSANLQQHQSKSNTSSSNTPTAVEQLSPTKLKEAAAAVDWVNQSSKEWTKFTESPTSNLSSPGPKPVNFDMQRTVQAVGADPQILHPVPLRVTPVGLESIHDEHDAQATAVAARDFHRKSESLLYDSSGGSSSSAGNSSLQVRQTADLECSTAGKMLTNHQYTMATTAVPAGAVVASSAATGPAIVRETNDLRAIQRPQSKKLPSKHVGGLPPPPQRESSIGSIESADLNAIVSAGNAFGGKKDVPPPPPPRCVCNNM